MSSKSKGANHGARRFVKAVGFSAARVKTPKRKKPLGYDDETEQDETRT